MDWLNEADHNSTESIMKLLGLMSWKDYHTYDLILLTELVIGVIGRPILIRYIVSCTFSAIFRHPTETDLRKVDDAQSIKLVMWSSIQRIK